MIKNLETSMIWNGGEITDDMYAELQAAFISSAEKIAAKAKANVPVGDLEDHGIKASQTLHLRDTIRAVGRRKRSRGETFARGLAGGSYETALPGAWVFAGKRRERVYWHHWVEYGTYNGAAHPYLRPAADSSFNSVLAEAGRAGRRVINKRRRNRVARRKAAA